MPRARRSGCAAGHRTVGSARSAGVGLSQHVPGAGAGRLEEQIGLWGVELDQPYWSCGPA
jgi:hypothetical protein